MAMHLHFFVPGAALWWIYEWMSVMNESLAKRLVMAKLNMAYLSSLKNRAKLLLSLLPVSPSRVLRAPGTSLVPFGAEAPSGHMAKAWAIPPPSWGLLCQWHLQQTTTPETNVSVLRLEPSDILKEISRFIMTTNYAIIWKWCLNYTACITLSILVTPHGVIRF